MRADQIQVWDEVDRKLAEHGVASASAAMSDLYDQQRGDLARLAAGITPVDSQLGAVAQLGSRTIALDLVSRPNVFAALLPRLAQGYGLDALGGNDAAPDRQRAEQFVRAALEARRSVQETPGMGRAFGIESSRVVGGGLEVDGELVQLCAFPKGGLAQRVPAPTETSRIARPSARRGRLT